MRRHLWVQKSDADTVTIFEASFTALLIMVVLWSYQLHFSDLRLSARLEKHAHSL